MAVGFKTFLLGMIKSTVLIPYLEIEQSYLSGKASVAEIASDLSVATEDFLSGL